MKPISLLQKTLIVAALVAGTASLMPAETLIYHEIKVDSSGRIVPWYGTGPSQAYDQVVRATWSFWKNMRNCPNGIPLYMQHQVWKPDTDDQRGLGGDQIPMAMSSWDLLYGYLGDTDLHKNMAYMADYWLAHGKTPANSKWPNLLYPYNLDLHSGEYDGDMRAGKGFTQPDKAASFASELIVLYKITGNQKYLDAATAVADTLAAHIQPGDGDNAPWPYRVHALTGEVHKQTEKGKTFIASYTTNYTGALRMFNDLIAMKHGNVQAYAKSRDTVIAWLKAYPIKTNKWGPFFEDIPTASWSDTEINADTLATYVLQHPDWDPKWKEQVKGMLHWSYDTLANKEFTKWGVIPINEQTAYKVPGNSHTSRHASVEIMYCEATGDCTTKEDAIRRLNWATYMVDTDGKNRYPRDDNWLTDGYGDYIRHYLRAMAAAPELAPDDQNHLLRTSSVIQNIQYGADRITYKKFDARSTELLKMAAWKPKSVKGATMKWDDKTHILTVTATSSSVTITK